MRDRKVLAGLSVILLVFVILAAHTLYTFQTVKEQAASSKEVYRLGGTDWNTGPVTSDHEIKQIFSVEKDKKFSGMKLFFGTFQRKNTARLQVELKETKSGRSLGIWNLNTESLTDGGFAEFSLNGQEHIKEKTSYTVLVSTENDVPGNTVALLGTDKKAASGSSLYAGGKKISGEISLLLTDGKQNFLYTYFAVITLTLFGMLGLLWWLGFVLRVKPHRLFLVLGTALGLLYIFVLPPYSTPDESAHISTVYYYSSRLMGQEALDNEGKTLVRPGDSQLNAKDHKPGAYTYGIVTEHLFEQNNREGQASLTRGPLSGVPWFVYAPQILAVTICRILHVGNVGMLMAGRIAALAVYLLLVYFAVKKMPFAKTLMVMIPLLPIALELGGSFSYDSMINGLCFLFAACCLNLIYEKKKIELKDWILLGILSALMSPCKIVYVLLCFLLLLIPKSKAPSRRIYWAGTGLVFGSGLLSVAVVRIVTMVNYISRQENTLSYVEAAGYTVGDILSAPLHMLKMLYHTFVVNGEFYFNSMMGGTLGWLEIGVSAVWITLLFVLLVLSVQPVNKEKADLKIGTKLCFLGIILAVGLALMGVFLLTWTPAGKEVIEGVQGRYFLPILPLLVLLFRYKGITIRENIDHKIIMLFGIVQFFIVWEVFQTVIVR